MYLPESCGILYVVWNHPAGGNGGSQMPVFRYWQLATAADVKKEGFTVKSGHGQMAGHGSARRERCASRREAALFVLSG